MVTNQVTVPHACKSGTHRGSRPRGNLQSLQNETPLPQKKNKLRQKRCLKSSNIIVIYSSDFVNVLVNSPVEGGIECFSPVSFSVNRHHAGNLYETHKRRFEMWRGEIGLTRAQGQ